MTNKNCRYLLIVEHSVACLFLHGDRLRSEPSPLVKRQEEAGVMYKRAFVGRALVDWMVVNQEAISRAEAVIEGKLLLQNEVIRHGIVTVVV